MGDGQRRAAIKDWPRAERPRERLVAAGSAALSDAELVAIVLRTGHGATGETALDLARRLLAACGRGGLHELWSLGVDGLSGVAGMGPAKAVQILAAMELGRRAFAAGIDRTRVRSPEDVYDVLRAEFDGLDREAFRVVLLNTKHGVLGVELVAMGGLDSSPVHPREVFKPAIRSSAAAVILAHNHPSGDPEPSPDDVAVTERLGEAGRLLGIPILDHIIMGDRRFRSLRAMGVAF